MTDVAVLPKAFSMISRQRHERGFAQREVVELGKQFANVVVDVADFRVVLVDALLSLFVSPIRAVARMSIRLERGELLP